MNKLHAVLCFVFLFVSNIAFSQNYFQQEVNYTIQATLNDKIHELSANISIEYTNNSPDELSFLYFHLWPNAYQHGTDLERQLLRDGKPPTWFDDKKEQGFIDSLNFISNHQVLKWEFYEKYKDICIVYLNKPLKTGEKIVISTPFRVKIPMGNSSRLGHLGESYQITQWYPKPAVYDNRGWHQMPYLNQGEFYSEFGNFDVTIRLPRNYIVGATGDLQNPEEMEWLDKLAAQTANKSFNTSDISFPPSDSIYKTLHYKQQKVHDFAWFADKRFNVLKSEVELPYSKKKVTTWAMFPNNGADLWKKANEYINDALFYYSKWNGDYPYSQCTAVLSSLSAGAGMEYPNVTVIGNSGSDRELETVIMHEVGHNWYYGILGFNERDFAWMDEGINSFAEARYMRTKYPENNSFFEGMGIPPAILHYFDLDKISYKEMQLLSYLVLARLNKDQAASLNSDDYNTMNYGSIIYMKVARVMDYLFEYMGEEAFDAAMQDFYSRWKFKHPYPEDLQKVFEKHTNTDLSWLFIDLLKTRNRVNYKIKRVKENQVLVKNVGAVNSPIELSGFLNNEPLFSIYYEGFSGRKFLELPNTKAKRLKIDANGDMLEFNALNNQLRTSGIFRKVEPLKIKVAGIMENSSKTQINIFPTLGWNNNNKFMLGAVFYNSVIPSKVFEYQLMPMYSFGSKSLAGSGSIAYHFLPYSNIFQSIDLSVTGIQYAIGDFKRYDYKRIKTGVDFVIKEKSVFSKRKQSFSINYYWGSDYYSILTNNPDNDYHAFLQNREISNTSFINVNYHYSKTGKQAFNLLLNSDLNMDFGKMSMEANYTLPYFKNNDLDFRLFAGTFVYKQSSVVESYEWHLSGHSPTNDYLYNQVYLSRFSYFSPRDVFSHQFSANEGGFASYSEFSSNTWMISSGLTVALPFLPKSLPLKIFGNIAYYEIPYSSQKEMDYESGIKFSILKNTLNIYFPILVSDEIRIKNDILGLSYVQRIRFSLSISQFNPFQLIKTIW